MTRTPETTAAIAAIDASKGVQPAAAETFSFSRPRTLGEAIKLAELVSISTMVPKEYQGNAGNCLIAMQMGAELGMPPLMALQNIAVINGRGSVWGDLMLAICQKSAAFGGIKESFDNETMTARCETWRKGADPVVTTFSQADAQTANLSSKKGPWQEYPKRMMQMRARGFALRDTFPGELKGLISREEAEDYPVRDQHGRRAQRPQGVIHDAQRGNPRQHPQQQDASRDAQAASTRTQDAPEGAHATEQQVMAFICNARTFDELRQVRDMGAGLDGEAKARCNAAFNEQWAEIHRDQATREADRLAAQKQARGNGALMDRMMSQGGPAADRFAGDDMDEVPYDDER